MAFLNGVENTLDNFRVFEVIGATTDLDASLSGGVLNLTKYVRGINSDGISAVKVTAAATGVNTTHTVDIAAAGLVIGDLKVITIDYSDLELGQTIPYVFRFKVASTNTTTQAAAIVTQIQNDSRYANAPFTISSSTTVITITDAPTKVGLIAGEITANDVLTSLVGDVVILNVSTARVIPYGQPAQLNRIVNASGNTVNPGIAPRTRFIGTVSLTAVYTTITIDYRLDTKSSNPVSDAAHPHFRDVMFIDEAGTNFAYIKSVIQNLAGAANGLPGDEIKLLKAITNAAATTIPVGAVSGEVAAGTNDHDVYLAAGFPIGSIFSLDNNAGGNTDLVADVVAGDTIDGAAKLVVATTVKTTIRKVTATDWTVIA